jgi:hypothetical protein
MSLKKIIVTFFLSMSLFCLADFSLAKEAKRSIPEVLKEVDGKIQSALDAIPSGDTKQIVDIIKSISENSEELSASYKFEFERDKVFAKVRKAREAAKKSDFSTVEQELKGAREGFAKLPNFL